MAPPLHCVVLCGGRGTRLHSAVPDRPKALADVGGQPFLVWLLRHLRRSGIESVTLATGHLGEMIEHAIGHGRSMGLSVSYSHETVPLGTAGALRMATERLDCDRLIAVNGDTFCHLDLDALAKVHQSSGASATMQLVHVADVSRYGAVESDESGRVTSFREKGTAAPGWASTGVCLLERRVLQDLHHNRMISLETEVLPALIDHGLQAVRTDGPLIDIGVPETYRKAATLIKQALSETIGGVL